MKFLKKNWLKHLLQWGVVLTIAGFVLKLFGNDAVDPEAYCPFGGLQTLVTYLERGSMACSMTATQIMVGIVLALGVMLFSKLFCGYLCPLGLGNELLGRVRGKLKINAIEIPYGSIADKALRSIKYILLFWIFYMTVTSSELFCKNFDPYYAFATGFKGEITAWMASISIVIFIVCSFFVKMFWCKYICPLGGISNIFKFALSFAAVVAIYVALNAVGADIPWVALLAAICIVGYAGELFCGNPKIFPLLKIVKDESTCNSCGLCSKRCPYGIDVANLKSVKHVDCTLCGECIASCNKQSLTVSGSSKLRWVPGILTVVLFFVAIGLGNKFEIPTIDEIWGDEANHTELSEVRVDGLRSVKCYGSSMAFAAKLQKIQGVYGVETYVKHSYVVIKYNPAQTTEDVILRSIYEPSKFKINHPEKDVDLIKVITIRTENMHDKMDPNYLGLQIRNSERKYYGLETEYDCPIIVKLYADLSEPIDEEYYKSMVEMKVLEMPQHGGGVKPIEVDYEYVHMEPTIDTITRLEFLRRQFTNYDQTYKKNRESWDGESKVVTYEVPYETLDKPIVTRYVPYLSSYMSLTEGVLAFRTMVNDNGDYVMQFDIVEDTINADQLWAALIAPKWQVWMIKENAAVEIDAALSFADKGAGYLLE
ncbi:MAG: 4Fe-4S binding protein [Rikenellaceae bacterium]